ncbi:Endonuclease/exonuclease/phosphatase [Coprinopsis sp. MPI-PUGE-AT-0042]|nr:Endonuclease/exonuclease/phosphatase [Coprinopsis sp. MPI-PUGE-AT-0042]
MTSPATFTAGLRHPSKRKKKNLKANIRIATLNMRGGGSETSNHKWQHMQQVMRENKIGIMAVQETHLKPTTASTLNKQFETTTRIISSSFGLNTNAAGVAFILNKSMTRWSDTSSYEVVPGRALLISTPWKSNRKINILNVYVPNTDNDNKNFWDAVRLKLASPEYKDIQPHIVLGDFNKVEDVIDRLPMKEPECENVLEALRRFKSLLGIKDGWRDENPDEIAFTYMQDTCTAFPSQSWIDRIYVTEETLQNSRNFRMYHSGITTADHKIVECQIFDPSSPNIGQGRWAMPPYAVESEDLQKTFRKMTADAISDTILSKLKRDIMQEAKDWCKKKIPRLKSLMNEKEKELKKIHGDKTLQDDLKVEEAGRLENEIKSIAMKVHSNNRLDVQTRFILENEVVGKVWISANKESKPRDTIKHWLGHLQMAWNTLNIARRKWQRLHENTTSRYRMRVPALRCRRESARLVFNK